MMSMDSFMAAASDLDSILDQFEQNEDLTSVLEPDSVTVNKSANYPYNSLQQVVNGNDAGHSVKEVPSGVHSTDRRTGVVPTSSSNFLLDLSEADFAPATPPRLPLHSLTDTHGSKAAPLQPTPMNNGLQSSSLPAEHGRDSPDFGRMGMRSGNSCEPHQHQPSVNMDTNAMLSHDNTRESVGVRTTGITEMNPKPSDNVTGECGEVNCIPQSSQCPTTGVVSISTGQTDPSKVGSLSSVTAEPSSSTQTTLQATSVVQPPAHQSDGPELDSSGREGASDPPKEEMPAADLETKALSKAMTPAPLRPELMHEYVKQGARPKMILKTPESPAKAVTETPVQTKPPVRGPGQPKPPVGFGHTANVSVTDAELEALEKEIGIMPARTDKGKPVDGPSLRPQTRTATLPTEERPLYHQSPASKDPKSLPMSDSGRSKSNELAGLDPFLTQESTKVEPVLAKTNNLLECSPMQVSSHSNVPQVGSSVDSVRPAGIDNNALPNNVLSKNAKNLLRSNQALPGLTGRHVNVSKEGDGDLSSQLNNSNSQAPLPALSQAGMQSDSVTALQGISLAISATAGVNLQQPSPQQPLMNLSDQTNKDSTSQPRGPRAPSGLQAPARMSSVDQQQQQPVGEAPMPSFLPADPPSYQDVIRKGMSGEADRTRLTLNFDQAGPRKVVAQVLPHSPILEDVEGREEAFSSVPDQGPAHSTPQANIRDTNQPTTFQAQPQTHTQQLTVDANNAQPTPTPNPLPQTAQDNDSMTPSNETDSVDGEFSRQVMDYSEGAVQLGAVAPVWVPDAEALNCMNCQQKFTFRKRRHHCRACGKVFCAKCCSMRLKLKYMESKEARVCISCLNVILRAQALQRTQAENQRDSPTPPDQDNVSNLSNTSDNTQTAGSIGSRSSLRRPSNDGIRPKETRKVRFSDGLNPGAELAGQESMSEGAVTPGPERGSQSAAPMDGQQRALVPGTAPSLIPAGEEALPPVIVATETKGEYTVQQNPVSQDLIKEMQDSNALPVAFALNKNLLVRTKILNLNCCVNRTCWCFSTKGMATVGQDEIVIVLECLPNEKTIPRDIFQHLQSIYEQASRGNTVSHMGHTLFSQSFLGGREHGGFLYLRPSYQCLAKLLLPDPPYLFAVLLQKWETPWAKVFPLRLLLRLGAEFRYYPCPLMSVRFRKPVFGEIGHTIMNLLADFKNYQYKLPIIPGIVIHMQDRETLIRIPRNRYNEVMKVMNNSNEHVMAIAANFSSEADSHLVCIQNDEGTYHTQAISIQNKSRKVTGASFVVFNGALKTTSGLTAKSSIVEDGLMIQILPETMSSLRQALRQMLDLPIPCGSSTTDQPDETVTITWVDDDKSVNMGVISPIDRRSLDGVDSVRIHNGTDFRGRAHSLRWTEVFFLENDESPVDLSRLAEMLSTAFCVAMTGQLDALKEAGMIKLALRVTVDSDNVGYEAGSKGELLPPIYMNELDNELIPVLHNAVSQHEGGPVVMELVFYIVE